MLICILVACPDGWNDYSDGLCITLKQLHLSWEDAMESCQVEGFGGSLVNIPKDKDNKILQSLIGDQEPYWIGSFFSETLYGVYSCRLSLYKLGLKDNGNQTFSWINRETLNFTNWEANSDPDLSPEENNNFFGNWGWGSEGDSNCISIKKDGLWRKDTCWSEFKFICQRIKPGYLLCFNMAPLLQQLSHFLTSQFQDLGPHGILGKIAHLVVEDPNKQEPESA